MGSVALEQHLLRALALAALALSVGATREARAEEPAQMATSHALFYRARELMNQGDYALACPKLEQALALAPDGSGIKFNLAFCYEHVGKVASAWGLFLDVANVEKLAGHADREQAARSSADALASRVPHLTLEVGEPLPGLTITRGGVQVERAMWGSRLPVDPGDYEVRASAPTRVAWTTRVHLDEGSEVSLSVPKLAPAPAPPPPAAHDAPAHAATGFASWSWQRKSAVVLGGAGVLAVATGTVFALVSMGEYSDANASYCDAATNRCSDPRGVTLRQHALTHGDVATGAFVGGGAALAAGAVLWLVAPSRSARTDSARALRAWPEVDLHTARIQIGASF